jgi:hypothetical protein
VVLLLVAQVLSGHRWKPVSQAGTQAVPLQVTLPFVGGVQVRQSGPQAALVLLATQVGALAVPRWQKPGELQMTRQLNVPGVVTLSQAAMPFMDGSGHAVHDVPHELKLLLATQLPVPAGQRWKPALQAVPQVLEVQTAWALGSEGFPHVAHPAAVPQATVLSSG